MNQAHLFSSADLEGAYRYSLTRAWGAPKPSICWIMLNPSTADAGQDDPTIRRCVGFSQRWGAGALIVVNLFAYRATDPCALLTADDPVGPRNDQEILRAAGSATEVIAAWGRLGQSLRGRDKDVLGLIPRPVLCLGLTQEGYPRHPLYMPKDAVPMLYHTHSQGRNRAQRRMSDGAPEIREAAAPGRAED